MIFQSQAMQQLTERARRFARTAAAVLIQGESGTGKELLARFIHEQSPRRHAPCIRVNCASFTEQLMESDLFGHEQGAFTGANRQRPGCFEMAGTGTVLLDEIGELPVPLQARLLRVVEDEEFRRVGGTAAVPMKARVVTATNRVLEDEIADGRFREDLYHRISILTLTIPPLRDRPQDIPSLVTYFVKKFSVDAELPIRGVSSAVMRQLAEFDWPGNVRQLRNVIHRACIESRTEVIESVELPQTHAPEAAALPEINQLPLREIERIVILARLQRFNGNRVEAAAALGVTPRTLRNKVMQYRKLGYTC